MTAYGVKNTAGAFVPQLLTALLAVVIGYLLLISLATFGGAKSMVAALGLAALIASLGFADKRRRLFYFIIATLPLLVVPIPPRRYGISVADVIVYLLVAMIILKILVKEAPSLLGGRTVLTLPLLFLATTVFLSTAFASDTTLPLTEIISNIKYVLFYLIFLSMVKTKRDFRIVVLLIVAGFVPAMLLGLAQFFGHIGLELNPDTSKDNASFSGEGFSFVRAFGPFSESLTYAQYLMMPLGLVGALATYARNWFWTAIWATLFALGAVDLICTLARGPWAAFFATVAIIAWVRIPKRMLAYLTLWPLAALAFAVGYWDTVLPMIPPAIADRLIVLQNDFDNGRSIVWTAGIEIFKDHPLFGVGLRNLYIFMPIYDPLILGDVFFSSAAGLSADASAGRGHVHVDSFYLTLLPEVGVVGMAAFLLVVVIALRQAYLNFRTAPVDLKVYALGVLGGLLGTLFSMFSVYGYADPRLALELWMMLAMVVSLQRIIANEARQPTDPTASTAGLIPTIGESVSA